MNIRNLINIDKNIKFYLKALALLFVISGAFGFITAQQFPFEAGMAVEQASGDLSFLDQLSSMTIFSIIALNNSVKAIIIILLGILWGIVPVLFILINGYVVGVVVSVVTASAGFSTILLGTIPHGIFEIPAILLAASYGVWLGEMFTKKLKDKKIQLNVSIKYTIGKFMRIILPVLVLAAFIEAFFTKWLLDAFIL